MKLKKKIMKNGYKIFIFSIIISVSLISFAQGATAWPYGSTVNQSVTVTSLQDFEHTGDVKFTRNNATLRIWGKLKIFGDVIIDDVNSFSIIIEDGGSFEVTGTVNITSKGTGGGSVPSINIDGVLSADSIIGNGNITGSGILYTNNISGLDHGSFTGPIIDDNNTAMNFPTPFGLVGVELPNLQVDLDWGFNDATVNGYMFVGFQVIRNMGGIHDIDEIIEGEIVNGIFTGNQSKTFIDNDLTIGAIPRYYIKAVFQLQAKSSGDYIFSSESNIKDFSANPLPIELLDFTAKTLSQGVTITWSTAAEINNDYFTVERSTDGHNWEILTYVQGAGNSNTVLTYNYEDLNPLQGISYYRLKQTDFDGQFEYFSPVAVQFNSVAAKSEIVGVNTIGQQIDLVLSTRTQNTHLIIADIQGRIIHTQLLNGNDSVQQISVNLPSSYSGSIVVVRLADNQNSDERKIRVF